MAICQRVKYSLGGFKYTRHIIKAFLCIEYVDVNKNITYEAIFKRDKHVESVLKYIAQKIYIKLMCVALIESLTSHNGKLPTGLFVAN